MTEETFQKAVELKKKIDDLSSHIEHVERVLLNWGLNEGLYSLKFQRHEKSPFNVELRVDAFGFTPYEFLDQYRLGCEHMLANLRQEFKNLKDKTDETN